MGWEQGGIGWNLWPVHYLVGEDPAIEMGRPIRISLSVSLMGFFLKEMCIAS